MADPTPPPAQPATTQQIVQMRVVTNGDGRLIPTPTPVGYVLAKHAGPAGPVIEVVWSTVVGEFSVFLPEDMARQLRDHLTTHLGGLTVPGPSLIVPNVPNGPNGGPPPGPALPIDRRN